ncbi:MAG: glycerophosphodiester phosphodiesterase, partial [Myxococcales bacterium]|nr:glycerophosphodiester phosphodiesterase [Myxococcales bacterium]
MSKLFLFLIFISVASLGCESSSTVTGAGGQGGQGGTGGSEPKCATPQEMLRCDKVVNIAHRGGRRIRPEHTLLAYDQALQDGADILELDVHETSDGMLVVIHDDTVDRTTDCTGLIKEMTFADIRNCDAGYEFSNDDGQTYPYRGMGLVVPTMDEVFDRYPDTPFIIEVKQSDPSIVDHFVEVIREYGVEDKMTGSAFADSLLSELRAAAPEIPTNMGTNETFLYWGFSFSPLDPSYQPPAEFLQVPPQFDVGDRIVDVLHPGFVPRAHELDML